MRIQKMRYIFPIGLFLAVFLDGTLTHIWSGWMVTPSVSIESRLVMLWLFMAVCFGDVEHIIPWTIFAGFVYDMFYTGIIGVFLLLLPLMIYITRWIIQYFEPSFVVFLLIYLIEITLLLSLGYGMNVLINQTNISVITFIGRTLGPSLAYNLAFFVVLYYPLKKMFLKYS
ncbi:MAG TPA: rod shape-determining protein MreD [Candidatus Ligilactobacillus excrementigallinarum]|uniref:Rod shape-determining protein MreD n=1 Tax=Candidatus Ligilactobacillus excrementigallinarum TaxID=2838641 RepID=A0A9D1UXS4_9LACO|nr:rod shape-determining protein MreD [Candidatus Ligilactobacillus excrementigallinarum]